MNSFYIFFHIILKTFKTLNIVTPTSAKTAIHIVLIPKTRSISTKNLTNKANGMFARPQNREQRRNNNRNNYRGNKYRRY